MHVQVAYVHDGVVHCTCACACAHARMCYAYICIYIIYVGMYKYICMDTWMCVCVCVRAYVFVVVVCSGCIVRVYMLVYWVCQHHRSRILMTDVSCCKDTCVSFAPPPLPPADTYCDKFSMPLWVYLCHVTQYIHF